MPETTPDHDLLVELRTEMRGVRSDIQDMRTSLAARVLNLESNSVSKVQFDDHEHRMRLLENGVISMESASRTWRYILSLGIAIGVVLSTIISAYISTHH
jgi:hypothetical protein